MPTLRLCAAMLFVAAAMLPAQAGTRVYLIRGIHFGPLFYSDGMDQIGARLRRPGVTVLVGDWTDRPRFERDALGHRGDLIVIAGHSMGAKEAGAMGDDLYARGYRVKVVMLDPLLTGARTESAVSAVCFYDSIPCGGNARNVHLPSPLGHVGYPADRRVQARVIAAVGR